jgi:hypothetical protein
VTPIEKIRVECAEERCESPDCQTAEIQCDVRRLAADKLKLSEALEQIRLGWDPRPRAERALAEMSK